MLAVWRGQCAWVYFIGGSTAIDNQAHSGLTTETFRNEGHYDIVKKDIRPGHFCLFQFGHNDQKLAHLQAQTGYKENLMNYVNEIRGSKEFRFCKYRLRAHEG